MIEHDEVHAFLNEPQNIEHIIEFLREFTKPTTVEHIANRGAAPLGMSVWGFTNLCEEGIPEILAIIDKIQKSTATSAPEKQMLTRSTVVMQYKLIATLTAATIRAGGYISHELVPTPKAIWALSDLGPITALSVSLANLEL